jgi:hypothetical protein
VPVQRFRGELASGSTAAAPRGAVPMWMPPANATSAGPRIELSVVGAPFTWHLERVSVAGSGETAAPAVNRSRRSRSPRYDPERDLHMYFYSTRPVKVCRPRGDTKVK